MKEHRPSLTAELVASLRAFYTELGPPYDVAPDPYAKLLVAPLLRVPATAAHFAPWAAPFLHRTVGAALLGLSYHVPLRTRAIDDALRDFGRTAGSRFQLVILGAGLDSRADRLPELANARVFEVDYPSSHRYKVEQLAKAGRSVRTDVVRVAIDFEKDILDDILIAAKFEPSEPSFWIWEGVTVYLPPDVIEETIGRVGRLACPKSRLAMTYTRPAKHDGGVARSRLFDGATRALASIVGEPVRGMMSKDVVATFLERAGFALLSDESAMDWSPRFWGTPARGRIWEHLAIAERLATTPRRATQSAAR